MNVREGDSQRVAMALRNAGVKVDSVFDLVNSRKPYAEAIPVLIDLLPTIRDNWIKEGVVRALGVKEAAGDVVARLMIREFEKIELTAPPAEQGLKWAIANTLSVVAQNSVLQELAALACDKRHGKSREMLVEALGKMRDPRTVDFLLKLLDDDEVAGHAIRALGMLRARAARPRIERFLDHPKPWVRKEAKRALAKLD